MLRIYCLFASRIYIIIACHIVFTSRARTIYVFCLDSRSVTRKWTKFSHKIAIRIHVVLYVYMLECYLRNIHATALLPYVYILKIFLKILRNSHI